MPSLTADADLAALADSLRRGEETPADHLAALRERFAAVEPEVRAFVDEDDRWGRLDRAADALAARFPDPGGRPPLYGVPVGVKDIVHADGFETRAGSDVPPAALTGPEAPVVSRLRDAGALVLGKTVTAEFAYFEPGPTRNPHDTGHTPGGSSSGSAAAVAAGLCPLALGTQTIGSVNRPAAFCGVVGVKPSYDRVPTEGVLPVAPSVDTVGFFTGDLAGAERAAAVCYDDWRAGADPDPPVVGVVDGPYLDQADPAGREAFAAHVAALEAAGVEVRRVEVFEDVAGTNGVHESLVAAETALSHSDLYPEYGDRYAAATADLVEQGRDVPVGALCDARANRGRLRGAVHDRMAEHGLDVVVSPSAPGPAPEGIDDTGDPVMNLPWTHAGLPTVTLPASTTDAGLPVGLQVAARFGEDERLLAWCRDLAAALDGGAG